MSNRLGGFAGEVWCGTPFGFGADSVRGISKISVSPSSGGRAGAGSAGASTELSCMVTAICVACPRRRDSDSLIGSRSFASKAARANLFGAAMMNVPPTATTGCVRRIHACC